MRTTVDLPDDLMRRLKIAAASRGLKLKQLIADLIEQGLAQRSSRRAQREPLPEFTPSLGRDIPVFTSEQMEAILLREEMIEKGLDRPA
jgi:hypothetical protein